MVRCMLQTRLASVNSPRAKCRPRQLTNAAPRDQLPFPSARLMGNTSRWKTPVERYNSCANIFTHWLIDWLTWNNGYFRLCTACCYILWQTIRLLSIQANQNGRHIVYYRPIWHELSLGPIVLYISINLRHHLATVLRKVLLLYLFV